MGDKSVANGAPDGPRNISDDTPVGLGSVTVLSLEHTVVAGRTMDGVFCKAPVKYRQTTSSTSAESKIPTLKAKASTESLKASTKPANAVKSSIGTRGHVSKAAQPTRRNQAPPTQVRSKTDSGLKQPGDGKKRDPSITRSRCEVVKSKKESSSRQLNPHGRRDLSASRLATEHGQRKTALRASTPPPLATKSEQNKANTIKPRVRTTSTGAANRIPDKRPRSFSPVAKRESGTSKNAPYSSTRGRSPITTGKSPRSRTPYDQCKEELDALSLSSAHDNQVCDCQELFLKHGNVMSPQHNAIWMSQKSLEYFKLAIEEQAKVQLPGRHENEDVRPVIHRLAGEFMQATVQVLGNVFPPAMENHNMSEQPRAPTSTKDSHDQPEVVDVQKQPLSIAKHDGDGHVVCKATPTDETPATSEKITCEIDYPTTNNGRDHAARNARIKENNARQRAKVTKTDKESFRPASREKEHCKNVQSDVSLELGVVPSGAVRGSSGSKQQQRNEMVFLRFLKDNRVKLEDIKKDMLQYGLNMNKCRPTKSNKLERRKWFFVLVKCMEKRGVPREEIHQFMHDDALRSFGCCLFDVANAMFANVIQKFDDFCIHHGLYEHIVQLLAEKVNGEINVAPENNKALERYVKIEKFKLMRMFLRSGQPPWNDLHDHLIKTIICKNCLSDCFLDESDSESDYSDSDDSQSDSLARRYAESFIEKASRHVAESVQSDTVVSSKGSGLLADHAGESLATHNEVKTKELDTTGADSEDEVTDVLGQELEWDEALVGDTPRNNGAEMGNSTDAVSAVMIDGVDDDVEVIPDEYCEQHVDTP